MPTQADIRFAQAAIKAGFLGKEAAQALLKAQKVAEDASGSRIGFRDIATNKKALSQEQVRELEQRLGIGAPPKVQKFGPYLVQKKLGQGGMGAVYLATDSRNNVPVALKVLAPALGSDASYLQRFQREASTASKLQHPNIVACYGSGVEGNTHYMALEYVGGGDVSDLLKQGPIPEQRALEITRQVVQALAAAHQAGIVHRDIKPSNILVTRDGSAKLADLGLARAELDHSLTQSSLVLGTPHYMSPEQAQGQHGIDVRSDLYSLGATLYHMVCGEPPFSGPTAMVVLAQHLEGQIPSPKETVPELSDGICRVIEKCMAKAKEDRYQTPDELLEDVDRVLRGEEPRAGELPAESTSVRRLSAQPTVRERKGRRASRRVTASKRSSTSVVVAVLVGVLVVGGGGWWLLGRGKGNRGEKPETPPKTMASSTIIKVVPGVKEEKRLQNLYEYAVTYASEHPEDYGAAIEKFEGVEREGKGTKYALMAQDNRREVKKARDEAVSKALLDLRRQVAELVKEDRFAEALEHSGQFPGNLRPFLPPGKLGGLRTNVEEQAAEGFEALQQEARRLVEEGKFAEARQTMERAKGWGLPGIAEQAAGALTQIEEQEAAAREGEREEALAEYREALEGVKALARERRYEDALKKLGELAGSERFRPLGERLAQDRADLEKAKSVFDAAIEALPGQAGKSFSVKGIRGALKEVKEGKLVLVMDGAEFAQPVSALSAKELVALAEPAIEKLGGEGFLRLAIFMLYEGGKNDIAEAKALLEQAKAKGVEVGRYLALADRLEKGELEAEAEELFGRAKAELDRERWETCKSLVNRLKESYGESRFVGENVEAIEELQSQCDRLRLEKLAVVADGLLVWLNAGAGIVRDKEGRVETWQDQSGNECHATQVDPEKRPRLGREGRARKAVVQFQWGEFLDLGTQLKLANKSFSVAALVRIEKCAADGGTFFVRSESGHRRNHALLIGYVRAKDFAFNFWVNQLVLAGPEPDAKWHHWVCALDGKTRERRIFRDGIMLGRDVAPALYQGGAPIQVGGPFAGQLSDLRFYSRPLTEEEAKALAGGR